MTKFCRLLGAIALAGATALAHAQAYPSKPIRLVVTFPPGGPADIIGRTLANKIQNPFLAEQVWDPLAKQAVLAIHLEDCPIRPLIHRLTAKNEPNLFSLGWFGQEGLAAVKRDRD